MHEIDSVRPRAAFVFGLSAATPAELRVLAAKRAAENAATPAPGAMDGPARLAIVAASDADVCAHLASYGRGENPSQVISGSARFPAPKLAFLFAGQGSQYAGMGRSLYENEPVFRDIIDQCNEMLLSHSRKPLVDLLYPAEGASTSDINQTEHTQPALFAFECALARLWQSWGVTPGYVLGHSVGELAAACFAGGISLGDGLKLIAARGRLIQSLPEGGGMTAVFADEPTVRATIEPFGERLCIAAENGPTLQVISGSLEAIAEAVQQFEAAQIEIQPLTVSHAFHSALMEPILDEFEAVAKTIEHRPLQVPLISNLDGMVHPAGSVVGPDHWREHIRRTVQFYAGMRTLAGVGCEAFLEIGPATTLVGMARSCVDLPEALWLPSMKKGRDPWKIIMDSAARLYVRGVPVNLNALNGFDKGNGPR